MLVRRRQRHDPGTPTGTRPRRILRRRPPGDKKCGQLGKVLEQGWCTPSLPSCTSSWNGSTPYACVQEGELPYEIFESHAAGAAHWRAAGGGVSTVLSAESINPPTTPQVAPMTAKEKKNLDTALTWWREVDSGAPCGTGAQLSSGKLHPAQSQHQYQPRCVHRRFLAQRPPVNPIPDKDGESAGGDGRQGRFLCG